MTNKEAIEILKEYKQRLYDFFPNLLNEDIEAFDLAISALDFKEQAIQIQLPNGVTYSPELFKGCSCCDASERCMDAFCSSSINCNSYGKRKNIDEQRICGTNRKEDRTS